MPRGRKPKPLRIHELNGNPGKRPLNQEEPRFSSTAPSCPSHLPAEAKKEWKRIVKELAAAGLLTQADRAALAGYCAAYARWVEAEKQLKKDGPTYITPSTGVQHQSPHILIAEKALTQMHKFLVEFGMTPSSRTRLKAPPRGKDDQDLDDFLNEQPA